MDKEAKKYINDIKDAFPSFQKKEKAYFNRLKETILKEASTNPNLKYEDCVEKYGIPKEVVESFYESIDDEYIVESLKNKSYLKKTCIITLSIIILCTGMFYGYKTYQYNKLCDEAREQQPVKVETIITEE